MWNLSKKCFRSTVFQSTPRSRSRARVLMKKKSLPVSKSTAAISLLRPRRRQPCKCLSKSLKTSLPFSSWLLVSSVSSSMDWSQLIKTPSWEQCCSLLLSTPPLVLFKTSKAQNSWRNSR
eukprot:12289_5